MSCVLINGKINDKNSGLLKLSSLTITSGSRLAGWALLGLRTQKKTKNALKNPNEAFKEYLNSQFERRDIKVKVNKLFLCFNKTTLSVKAKREPIKSR